jgi:hypothetical protein
MNYRLRRGLRLLFVALAFLSAFVCGLHARGTFRPISRSYSVGGSQSNPGAPGAGGKVEKLTVVIQTTTDAWQRGSGT